MVWLWRLLGRVAINWYFSLSLFPLYPSSLPTISITSINCINNCETKKNNCELQIVNCVAWSTQSTQINHCIVSIALSICNWIVIEIGDWKLTRFVYHNCTQCKSKLIEQMEMFTEWSAPWALSEESIYTYIYIFYMPVAKYKWNIFWLWICFMF